MKQRVSPARSALHDHFFFSSAHAKNWSIFRRALFFRFISWQNLSTLQALARILHDRRVAHF